MRTPQLGTGKDPSTSVLGSDGGILINPTARGGRAGRMDFLKIPYGHSGCRSTARTFSHTGIGRVIRGAASFPGVA